MHAHELKESIDEAVERAHHAVGQNHLPPWTRQLSVTTAIIAVLTAVGSLGSEHLSHGALVAKNDMVHAQAKASDQWAYYQAKSMKGMLSTGFADTVGANQPTLARRYREEAQRYKLEQENIRNEATSIEKSIQGFNEEAAQAMHYQHNFALAVTLFQVSIAMSAIAVLISRRRLWLASLGISFAGLIFILKGLVYYLH